MTFPSQTMSTGLPASNGPDANFTPTGSKDLCASTAAAAPSSTTIFPDGRDSLSQRLFLVIAASARNSVPTSSPRTARMTASDSEDDAMIILHPASWQILAALSFVLIPPTAVRDPGPPAILDTDASTFPTTGTSLAPGCIFGFAS